MSEPEDFVVYEDEMQLLDWHESAKGGMTATFRIPDLDYKAHPMKRFATGTRIFCRMVEIGDDDQPIDQAKREAMREAIQEHEMKGGKLARDAGILCGDTRFQEFVVDRMLTASPADKRVAASMMPPTLVTSLKDQGKGILDDPRVSGEIAKWWLYAHCRIKSRRELDHKNDSANRYYQFVVKPYAAWAAGGKV